MEDREIIRLYFARDERAIAETSAKYGEYCAAIARNILKNEEDGKECVNDALLRVWNSIPPNAPDNLKLYLAKITRNLAFDALKGATVGKRGGTAENACLEEISWMAGEVSEVDRAIDKAAFVEVLNAFLRSLPKKQRDVFIRRYFFIDGTASIAARFGMTEDAVMKSLSRTRMKLKNYLQKEGYDL